MPGSSEPEAVGQFVRVVNLALGCVVDAQTKTPTRDYSDPNRVHVLSTGVPPLSLRAANGAARTGLSVSVQYQVMQVQDRPRSERFKVRTVRYAHQVYGVDSQHEIVLFHWHPETGQGLHVHVGARELTRSETRLTRQDHIPTGRVPVEALVRFLIADLAVKPLRSDWERVLAECEKDFWQYARWGGHPALDRRTDES